MSRWPTEEPDQPADDVEDDEEVDDVEDDEDPGEGVWELDPTDPNHPDYDLSTAAGYRNWEPAPKPVYLRRGVVVVVTVFIIVGLMIPLLVRIF